MKYFLFITGVFKDKPYYFTHLPGQTSIYGTREEYLPDDLGVIIDENRKGLKITITKLIRVKDGKNYHEPVITKVLTYGEVYVFDYEYQGKKDFLKFEAKKFSNRKDFKEFLKHTGDAGIQTYYELIGNERKASIYREKRYNYGREAANATSGMDPDIRADYARGDDK